MKPDAIPIRLTITCSVVNPDSDKPKVMASPLSESAEGGRALPVLRARHRDS